jgi:hypothetical protein
LSWKLQKEILSKYASHGVQTKDQFLQCYQCGKTIPIYEAKYEQTLEGFAEPTDNSFDSGEEVLGIPKRGTETGPKAWEKRKRERNGPRHKDREVDQALGSNEDVHIIYDSNPPADTR